MQFDKKLYEGQYYYFNKGRRYSEETFNVKQQDKAQGAIEVNSEIVSRVKTGEFLKINMNFQLSFEFDPLYLKIVRTLGSKKSIEEYSVDQKSGAVSYRMIGSKGTQKYERTVGGRFMILTPAFCTSVFMANTRKIDPVHRTPYNVIGTNNIWEYEEPFSQSRVFIEQISKEPVDISINRVELKASHVNLFDEQHSTSASDEGVPFYLSKHINLPYLAKFNKDMKVEIQFLKTFENMYKDMF